MPKSYELTPRAERDLKDIWLYTAQAWGDEQADNYVALLDKQFAILAASPYTGAARPDIEKECRFFPVGKHLIFYRIEDNDLVVILAVPHTSMDIGQCLENEGEQKKERVIKIRSVKESTTFAFPAAIFCDDSDRFYTFVSDASLKQAFVQ